MNVITSKFYGGYGKNTCDFNTFIIGLKTYAKSKKFSESQQI